MSAPGIHRRREPLPHAAVYALAIPRSRKPSPKNVRYVGQTGHPVDRRFRQHVRRTRARAVRDWIDSLDSDPVLFVLDEMPGANRIELTRREHERLDEYLAAGAALLNVAHLDGSSLRDDLTTRGEAVDLGRRGAKEGP